MGESLFLQGLVFSGIAVGAIALLAWWLYISPLKSSGADVHPAPARTARTLALLLGAGALLISIGGDWDASEHVVAGIVPGGDDFLWPPHLMLYAGFLISFIVALVRRQPGWRLAFAAQQRRNGPDRTDRARRHDGPRRLELHQSYS